MADRSEVMTRISATVMALMLFYALPAAASMPLTWTIHTLRESEFEAAAGAALIRADSLFRRESATLGFGILDDLSAWYEVQYLHRESGEEGDALGDSFFKLWYYLGNWREGRLHAGLALVFRVPTGPRFYGNADWRNAALGAHELKAGPAFQWKLPPVFLHGSAFYVVRQAEGEDFYRGFNGNPGRGKTYSSVFGLNPWSGGAFLHRDRLRNDYASASLAVNTLLAYPCIPFLEVYYSHRVYRRETVNDSLPVEGAGVDPLLAGLGLRFFITDRGFLEACGIIALVRREGYIRDIVSISASLVF